VKYVLDTNVVSALRVIGANPAVQAWARSVSAADLYVTAFTVAGLERGGAKKAQQDPSQGAVLRGWFDRQVLPSFAGRVLPFDLDAARVLAQFDVPEHAPLDDALIGAVAAANGMVMVTRNTKHFSPLGIPMLNPWLET
jgi:predicted nucleic acid-binding protein